MSDAVIVALITLCGTIVTTLVSSAGNRKALSNKIDGVDGNLKQHIAEEEKNQAISVRARILRFRNDLRAGAKFDEDYFDAILRDITNYKLYCSTHPDFPNEICLHAISYISRVYDELLATNGFEQD